MPEDTTYYKQVYEIVRAIPPGRVATYGGIAFLLGTPRRARMVGRAMSRLPSGDTAPWHRVVNSAGRLVPGHEELQRQLLEKENTPLRPDGKVDLNRALWDPYQEPEEEQAAETE